MCHLTYSVKSITDELNRVTRGFSFDRTYYGVVGNVHSMLGPIVKPSSAATWCHMNGNINPKICAKVAVDERQKLEATYMYNLLHKSAVQRDNTNGLSLPSSRKTVSSCRV